jgi:hypothetical protein
MKQGNYITLPHAVGLVAEGILIFKDDDDMYTKIMSRLDNLMITDVSFFESIDSSKKKKRGKKE